MVIRLAHISKKSIVWLPNRGLARENEPEKDPYIDPLWEGHSTLTESMLSRGRCRPAAEHERWGVEEPDLCSRTSSSMLVKSSR